MSERNQDFRGIMFALDMILMIISPWIEFFKLLFPSLLAKVIVNNFFLLDIPAS